MVRRAWLVIAISACISCASLGAGAVGTRSSTIAETPSGKRVAIYRSSTFATETREVPVEVVMQAMRSSSLFFEEDIRALAPSVTPELAKLEENQRVVVETNDTVIYVFVANGELQLVATRQGQEISRHAAAIPAAPIKTELTARKRIEPARPVPAPYVPPPVVARPVEAPPPVSDTPSRRASAHDKQAKAYADAGQYDGAVAEYKRSYDLVAKADTLFKIAAVYHKTGDARAELDYYQKYLSADPDGPHAAQAIEFSTIANKAIADQKPSSRTKVVANPKAKPAQPKKPAARASEVEIRAKLAELDRLLGKGLITKDEHADKRKRLLDQL